MFLLDAKTDAWPRTNPLRRNSACRASVTGACPAVPKQQNGAISFISKVCGHVKEIEAMGHPNGP